MHKKKGSHIGMMLSFVIFIIFLTFMYTLIEPVVKKQPSKNNLLEYLKKEIIAQTSDILVSATITNTTLSNYDCLLINHSKFLPANEFDYENMGYIVKDENGSIVSSLISLYGAGLERTAINWSGNQSFLKIFYSKENFTSDRLSWSDDCQSSTPNSSLGLVLYKKIVFENKMEDLIKKYNTNYILLKRDLKIPFDTDFVLDFVLENGTEIRTGVPGNISVNVFSEEYIMPYVDSKANIKSGKLKIWMW